MWRAARADRDRAEGLSKRYFDEKKQTEAKLERLRTRRATVLAEIDVVEITKTEEHPEEVTADLAEAMIKAKGATKNVSGGSRATACRPGG